MFPMWEVNFWWVLIHLIILSVEDIRNRQLSVLLILELGLGGLVYVLYGGHRPEPGLGILLLAFGYGTKEKIGYGDGYLMLALGMWLSDAALLKIFFLGICMASLYGVCMQKRELPLVPFLTMAYMMEEWI